MAPPTKTLFVEGNFADLAIQLADFLDSIVKDGNVRAEVEPLVEKPEEALQKLVDAAGALNSAPEKDIIPAYNLLIFLAQQSDSSTNFFPRICKTLCQPFSSTNGPAIALSILSSIFNLFPANDISRYHVLLSSIEVIRSTSSFDLIKPQLKQLPTWLAEWQLSEKDERALYLSIHEAAEETGSADAFNYLVAALRSFSPDDAAEPAARDLATKAVKIALLSSTVYDFNDLTALEPVQALRQSDPILYELLDIFVGQTREEYDIFLTEYPDWLEKNDVDGAVLTRKINLLTLASLAASASQTRSLPHDTIAKALKVPEDEVEMWVIDVIRAGLVEGKLSQSNKTFLIHRTTYRIFGDKQWQEVSSRLDTWRSSLTNVLQVLRAERVNLAAGIEQAEADAKTGQTGGGHHHQGQNQQQRRQGGNRGPRRDNRQHGNQGGNKQSSAGGATTAAAPAAATTGGQKDISAEA